MRRPDFFIVGAPKCGTTAMDEHLGEHPDIFMAERKEAHFFGGDLTIRYDRPTKPEYLSYFRAARQHKRVGESSVFYLVSKQAASEIKAFSPDAGIIIMLRNPVDMMYSLHSQLIYNSMEDITDFAAALQAEEDRKKGLRLASSARTVEAFFYREVAKYVPQVERYFHVFGRENVYVIIFDDFKADTAGEYRKTLEFLGVDPHFAPEFRTVNPNKRVRSTLLQRLIFKTKLARSHKFRSRLPEFLRRALRGLNIVYERRAPMDEGLRKQLQAEFAPEVKRLSELLGRDLTHWTAMREPAVAGPANSDTP